MTQLRTQLAKVLLMLALALPAGASIGAEIVVFKSASCGCCNDWIKHLEDAGFTVSAHDSERMSAVKNYYGVPKPMRSCHTAEVEGYVIEGHVPAADIRRLLAEKPATRGLAVPGMPVGSPGMEQGDRQDAYDVISFDENGKASVFARY